MSRAFYPVYSSTSDGSDITLCRILESTSRVQALLERSVNQQPYTKVSTASTNATLVKASSGTIFNLAYANMANSNAFIKFYNMATIPNPSVDTPVFIWPATKLAHDSLAFGINPMTFTVGIAFAIVSTINDGGNVGADHIVLNFSYA